jgi:glycosyltransferase involved in cell wall biosynthesis
MTEPRLARPILMTTDPFGGVWNYTLDLCRELGNHGVDVALASMGRSLTEIERAQVRRLPRVRLFEGSFKLEWMADPWHDVSAAGAWLESLSAHIAPSVVHLNQFTHGALPWNAPSIVVGHSCVCSWFQAVKRSPPGADWQKYKFMVARGLRGADAVTAPSHWLLAQLRHSYGDFAAAAPIYNGLDPARFAPAAKEDFILTAGRLWDDAKNIAILERLAPRLRWPIYAAGESASPDGGRTSLKHLRRLGKLEGATLHAWMARAAIFVLPARYEPFGLAALEAALSGCALVLGDIPSLREVWHQAALFASPDDPEEIRAALDSLIENSALRNRLAQEGRRRAQTFTAQRMARCYLALYRQLLDGAPPRRKIAVESSRWSSP